MSFPERKVLAAAFMATVATVGLVVYGEPSQEALVAVWAPVGAAYIARPHPERPERAEAPPSRT